MLRGLKNCKSPEDILDKFKNEEMAMIPEEDKKNLSYSIAGIGFITRVGEKLYLYG